MNPRPGLVLVVDDETPVLRALRRILDTDRQCVALASSPVQAASALRDPELDVVLVDLVMGGASGLELLERIKRERPEVEVIVMTDDASVASAVDCMRRGAFDYLTKPFDDLRRVRETVRRALARRRLAGHATGAEPMAEGVREARQLLGGANFGTPEPGSSGEGRGQAEIPLSLDAYEKSALERALQESGGDAGSAARRLGIGRSTFYRKLAKHGIGEGRGVGRQGEPGPGGVGSHSRIG